MVSQSAIGLVWLSMAAVAAGGCGSLPVAVPAEPAGERFELTDEGRELGTSYHVTVVVDRDVPKARAALAAARAECRRLEAILSEWNARSELTQLNRNAAGGTVELSRDLARLIDGALHVAIHTSGAFDPTWRPLGMLWDRAERRGVAPDRSAIERALGAVGWRNVRFDGQRVSFAHPETQLGIAGFAKGWIIDRVFKLLRAQGFEHVRVNIGGDVRARGRDANGELWRLNIVDPFDPTKVARRIAIGDTAVATSGNYFRYREIGGERIGHILDPRTGYPPEFDGSVTVLTRDAAMADALATALFVMGPERGLAFARRNAHLDAVFVTRDGVQGTLPVR